MKYESNIDIRKSLEYQQGYSDGYQEGHIKSLEQVMDIIFFNPSNPQIIVTTKENLESLRQQLKNK